MTLDHRPHKTDDEILEVLAEVAHDVAMWATAEDLRVDAEPMRAAIYRRLKQMCEHELEQAVVLLVCENGDAMALAAKIVSGARSTMAEGALYVPRD